MKIGLYHFPTADSIHPAEFGRAAEDAGFESIWFPEHSHIPVPDTLDEKLAARVAGLPSEYYRSHDQLVALAAISAVTSTIRLGTSITLVPQRDPIWLAKQVASLDTLSAGRVSLGIGYGWLRNEVEHHGVAFGERRAVLREHVTAMKRLWMEEEASFHGTYVQFGRSWAWPKPVQKPHPPIFMGAAASPGVLGWMAEHCQGWIPSNALPVDRSTIETVRVAVEEAGRAPDDFEICRFGASFDPRALDELREMGVDRTAFTIDSGSRDEALRQIDQGRRVVEQYRAD